MTIVVGDCREVLAGYEPETFHAVVTDPPYELNFMGRGWDNAGVSFDPETWRAVYRVLKPGGHLLAFGGSRTFHRIAVAIEDAGFEIRDTLMFLYGTGFPKSRGIGKAIDSEAGATREVVGSKLGQPGYSLADNGFVNKVYGDLHDPSGECAITAPATDAAREWDGWHTALKPAYEPIIMARKPFRGTVAASVIAHGTGALNIDGCRIETGDALGRLNHSTSTFNHKNTTPWVDNSGGKGRWPPNVAMDKDVARLLDEMSGERKTGGQGHAGKASHGYGGGWVQRVPGNIPDTGGASRYFKVVAHDSSSTYNVEELDGAPCGEGLTGAESISAGKRTESSDDSLLTDGSGSRPTGQSSQDTKFITSMGTNSTMTSPIFGALPLSGMTTITSDGEKPIESSMELSSEDVSDVGNTSRSTSSTAAWPEPTKDIASLVSDKTSESDETRTEKGITRERAPIDNATEDGSVPTRFMYVAKASRAERNAGLDGMPVVRTAAMQGNLVDGQRLGGDGSPIRTPERQNHHPCVKPIALMRWLVRMVTPPGGMILDPFAGSGSTGVAAALEGFDFTGIDLSEEYAEIARRRIAHAGSQPALFRKEVTA